MLKTNIKAVAEKLRISRRRIYALVEDGILPKPVDGNYDIKECVTCYLAYRIATDKEARIAWDRWQMAEDLKAGRPVRWTIGLAAREFGVSEAWLRRRLKETGTYYEPAYPAEAEAAG
jgi:AraC-like DNA-binding protein